MIKLAKLPAIAKFCVNINGTTVCSEKSKNSATDPKQAIANVKKRIKSSVKGPLEKPVAANAKLLIMVIGPPLPGDGAKSAMNPFAGRPGEPTLKADDPKVKQIVKTVKLKSLTAVINKVPAKLVEKAIVQAEVQNERRELKRMAHAKVTEKKAEKLMAKNHIKIPKTSETLASVVAKRKASAEKAEKALTDPLMKKALSDKKLIKEATKELKAGLQASTASKSADAKLKEQKIQAQVNKMSVGSVKVGSIKVNTATAPAIKITEKDLALAKVLKADAKKAAVKDKAKQAKQDKEDKMKKDKDDKPKGKDDKPKGKDDKPKGKDDKPKKEGGYDLGPDTKTPPPPPKKPPPPPKKPSPPKKAGGYALDV